MNLLTDDDEFSNFVSNFQFKPNYPTTDEATFMCDSFLTPSWSTDDISFLSTDYLSPSTTSVKMEPPVLPTKITESYSSNTTTSQKQKVNNKNKERRLLRRNMVDMKRAKRKMAMESNEVKQVQQPAVVKQRKLTNNVKNSSKSVLNKQPIPNTSYSSSTSMSNLIVKENKPPTKVMVLSHAADEKLKEMEAQLESLDPSSKEAKKQRRLIRNRMSAQLHRERRKAYVDQLEGELESQSTTIQDLMTQLQQARNQNSQLEATIQSLTKKLHFATNGSKTDCESFNSASSCSSSQISSSEESEIEICSSLKKNLTRRKNSSYRAPNRTGKSNIAMMMAIVFSVSFFGNSIELLENITKVTSSKNSAADEKINSPTCTRSLTNSAGTDDDDTIGFDASNPTNTIVSYRFVTNEEVSSTTTQKNMWKNVGKEGVYYYLEKDDQQPLSMFSEWENQDYSMEKQPGFVERESPDVIEPTYLENINEQYISHQNVNLLNDRPSLLKKFFRNENDDSTPEKMTTVVFLFPIVALMLKKNKLLDDDCKEDYVEVTVQFDKPLHNDMILDD